MFGRLEKLFLVILFAHTHSFRIVFSTSLVDQVSEKDVLKAMVLGRRYLDSENAVYVLGPAQFILEDIVDEVQNAGLQKDTF